MKKYLFFILVATCIYACSKEDWPDNSAPEYNWLAPDEEATDETSVLRREFYARNGIYLLFSDTLGVREKTTLAGETIHDYLILGYDMSTPNYTRDSFSYHYYTTQREKQKAVEFVEKYIFPNISEVFWPGAVLLLNRLEYFEYIMFDEDWNYIDALVPSDIASQNKLQAMVLGIGDVERKTEEEREALKNAILQAMVSDKISILPAEDLELFYSYSKDYYNINGYVITNAGLTYEEVGLLSNLEDNGYISSTSKDYDLAAFVERIFTISKAEFYEQFSGFPLVIKKMEALVDVLHKYDVKIYMEE